MRRLPSLLTLSGTASAAMSVLLVLVARGRLGGHGCVLLLRHGAEGLSYRRPTAVVSECHRHPVAVLVFKLDQVTHPNPPLHAKGPAEPGHRRAEGQTGSERQPTSTTP